MPKIEVTVRYMVEEDDVLDYEAMDLVEYLEDAMNGAVILEVTKGPLQVDEEGNEDYGSLYDEEPSCIGCKKPASKIKEVVESAMAQGLGIIAYVKQDGSYDMFKPNKFYCDKCYIKAGMPVHHGRRQF